MPTGGPKARRTGRSGRGSGLGSDQVQDEVGRGEKSGAKWGKMGLLRQVCRRVRRTRLAEIDRGKKWALVAGSCSGDRGVKPGPKNLFLQGGSLSGSHFSPVPSRTSSSVDREAGGKKGEDLKKPGPSKEKEKEQEQEKAKEEESTVPTETLTPASKQKTKKNQTNPQQRSQPVQPS